MRCSYKIIFILMSSNFLFSLYILYNYLLSSSQDNYKKHDTQRSLAPEMVESSTISSKDIKIEIWSKASIGYYLWEHIFAERFKVQPGQGLYYVGKTKSNQLEFIFRGGPAAVASRFPRDVKYLVLVLNGREQVKINYAIQWLEYVHDLPDLKKLAVILLGNENCQNDWIRPYLRREGGIIDCLFLVYDDPIIDNQTIFQWPLGVATYRNFDRYTLSSDELSSPRTHICNFFGTVYKNSSRETLSKFLESQIGPLNNICYIKERTRWMPEETKESMTKYINALLQSDLTLNPVGKNPECYRIYEALSLGSLPVIEDVPTSDTCARNSLRILKAYKNPPFIFIKSWNELQDILKNELTLPQWKKISRRNDLVMWYEKFLLDMKHKFINIINQTFFESPAQF